MLTRQRWIIFRPAEAHRSSSTTQWRVLVFFFLAAPLCSANEEARQAFVDFYRPLVRQLHQSYLEGEFRVVRLVPSGGNGQVDWIAGIVSSANYTLRRKTSFGLADLQIDATLKEFPELSSANDECWNSKYHFETRSQSSDYLLESLSVYPSGQHGGLCFLLAPIGIPTTGYLFADMMELPERHFLDFSEAEMFGRRTKILRISLTFHNIYNRGIVTSDFKIAFDPDGGHCLGWQRGPGTIDGKEYLAELKCVYGENDGFQPQLCIVDEWLRFPNDPAEDQRQMINYVVEFNPKAIAPERFRLSAFRLPEPEGVNWNSSWHDVWRSPDRGKLAILMVIVALAAGLFLRRKK